MTNHKSADGNSKGKPKYFKPTKLTPEIEKELKDPKGWITGRLLPKRRRQKNKIMTETPKGKGKNKPKGWKRKGYEVKEPKGFDTADPNKPSPATPVKLTRLSKKTEKELEESDEVD